LKNKSHTFPSILYAHKGIIYKVANSYCKDEEDRKDLIQEILIQIWRSFDRYNDKFKWSTWIYRIALNVSISHYRKSNLRKNKAIHNSEIIFQWHNNDDNDLHENVQLLRSFIQDLKEIDKALMLLYLDEKPYSEISEILGISISNISTKMNRIRTLLKQRFTSHQKIKK